jgi:hypothetical protein
MIKIQEVKKGDNYYTITFSEGVNAYGALVVLVDTRPVYIQFMKFINNGKDLISITEEDNPNEFKEMKEKYFDIIMKNVN